MGRLSGLPSPIPCEESGSKLQALNRLLIVGPLKEPWGHWSLWLGVLGLASLLLPMPDDPGVVVEWERKSKLLYDFGVRVKGPSAQGEWVSEFRCDYTGFGVRFLTLPDAAVSSGSCS